MKLVVRSMILLTAIFLIAGMSNAANKPVKSTAGPIGLVKDYVLDRRTITDESVGDDTQPLGEIRAGASSLGMSVGDTYWDLQHTGAAGRMVTWKYDATNGLLVHFGFTDKPANDDADRRLAYNCYSSLSEDLLSPGGVLIQTYGETGGYATVDATDDNRGVVGGHYKPDSQYHFVAYFDFGPGLGFFATHLVVPDSLTGHTPSQPESIMWPRMDYQVVPGQVPVLHVFAFMYDEALGFYELRYFRRIGSEANGWWGDVYIVDSVQVLGQDIVASDLDGKIALGWIASRPEEGDCDTCSSTDGMMFSQWDNDVYYQISYDYGDTWSPRVNLTKNQDGVDGYRPYTALEALFDSDNYLHLGYSARFWPADANSGGDAGLLRGGLFHWGENLGTGGYDTGGDPIITPVAVLDWDQVHCAPGAWTLNGSRPTMAECDGKLYYVWSQYNDVANGIEDDCANRTYSGDDIGSASADLYMSVSDDGGYSWDYRRNLTQTYLPNCDGSAGACLSETYPSLAEQGTDLDAGFSAPTYDPSGSYAGEYYVDLFYELDRDPGFYNFSEGTQQQADMNWVRLACVEPVPYAMLVPTPLTHIGWPTNTVHGVQLDTPLVLYNYGSADLTFSITVEEYSGPAGWLTTSGFESGYIPAGSNPYPSLSGTISLNTGGIVNSPGTVVHLSGALVFDFNGPESPITMPVECWVMDDFVSVALDTVSTGCLKLVHSNNGNLGNEGAGTVNLDFYNCGDCDVSEFLPGLTENYLYGGSPVVCWDDGGEIKCNQVVFNTYYTNANAFVAITDFTETSYADYSTVSSSFITRDSGIGIDQTLLTPENAGDSLRFVIEKLRFYSYDGETHSGLAIGQIMDWDVPSDSGLINSSGFDNSRNLIYLGGVDYSQYDGAQCQANEDRFGGTSLLEVAGITDDFYGMYVMDNATQAYPFGDFDPDSLWKYMNASMGWSTYPAEGDPYAACTYVWDGTLGPGDSLVTVQVYVTGHLGYAEFMDQVDRARAWYCEYFDPSACQCCEQVGDFNHSGSGPDISDLVYLVGWMFSGGPPPPCPEEGDCNGDGMCCDISDLVCWVNCMFQGGWCPTECP